MTSIQGIKNILATSFDKSVELVVNWRGYTVKAMQNQNTAIGVFATANILFFAGMSLIQNRLVKAAGATSLKAKVFTQVAVNGLGTAGFVLGFNVLLSQLTKFPLSQKVLAIITAVAVVARIITVGISAARQRAAEIATNKNKNQQELDAMKANLDKAVIDANEQARKIIEDQLVLDLEKEVASLERDIEDIEDNPFYMEVIKAQEKVKLQVELDTVILPGLKASEPEVDVAELVGEILQEDLDKLPSAVIQDEYNEVRLRILEEPGVVRSAAEESVAGEAPVAGHVATEEEEEEEEEEEAEEAEENQNKGLLGRAVNFLNKWVF